jgi:hypothetical protein
MFGRSWVDEFGQSQRHQGRQTIVVVRRHYTFHGLNHQVPRISNLLVGQSPSVVFVVALWSSVAVHPLRHEQFSHDDLTNGYVRSSGKVEQPPQTWRVLWPSFVVNGGVVVALLVWSFCNCGIAKKEIRFEGLKTFVMVCRRTNWQGRPSTRWRRVHAGWVV